MPAIVKTCFIGRKHATRGVPLWRFCGEYVSMIDDHKNLRRFNTPHEAHFLTFACFQHRPFLRSRTALGWLADAVSSAGHKHDFALWAYVFMPDHVHLLVCPRQEAYDVSKYLASVKLPVAKKALGLCRRSDRPQEYWAEYLDVQPNGESHFRFWQRGAGYDRNLYTPDEIQEKIAYIHGNPVSGGLCERVGDWPWSSAGQFGGLDGPVAIEQVIL